MTTAHGPGPAGKPYNGIAASQLSGLHWQPTTADGTGVELAKLPDGGVAVRNASDPDGPALIYTRAEIEALIGGAADGDFDDLLR
ncbi:MAG TPA: DUF397 domain-containing protein [Streptosporangiaceae bacterium]